MAINLYLLVVELLKEIWVRKASMLSSPNDFSFHCFYSSGGNKHFFHFEDMTWTTDITTPPVGRIAPSLVLISDNELLLFGGYHHGYHKQSHVYNMDTKVWTAKGDLVKAW